MSNLIRLKYAHTTDVNIDGMFVEQDTQVRAKVKNVAATKDVRAHYNNGSGAWLDITLPWLANYGDYDLFGRDGGGRGAPTIGGVASASANISAPAANFVDALRLAVEMLKEPAYPAEEFDRVLSQRTKALENPPTEPTQLASETLTRHLSPWVKGDALYNPTREEQLAGLKKVALDDVKKFHRSEERRVGKECRSRWSPY